MKRIDAFCDSCESEFGVELIDTEVVVKYCPVCGEKLSDEVLEEMSLDNDAWLEEDWED